MAASLKSGFMDWDSGSESGVVNKNRHISSHPKFTELMKRASESGFVYWSSDTDDDDSSSSDSDNSTRSVPKNIKTRSSPIDDFARKTKRARVSHQPTTFTIDNDIKFLPPSDLDLMIACSPYRHEVIIGGQCQVCGLLFDTAAECILHASKYVEPDSVPDHETDRLSVFLVNSKVVRLNFFNKVKRDLDAKRDSKCVRALQYASDLWFFRQKLASWSDDAEESILMNEIKSDANEEIGTNDAQRKASRNRFLIKNFMLHLQFNNEIGSSTSMAKLIAQLNDVFADESKRSDYLSHLQASVHDHYLRGLIEDDEDVADDTIHTDGHNKSAITKRLSKIAEQTLSLLHR
jgi:hypothetical protein